MINWYNRYWHSNDFCQTRWCLENVNLSVTEKNVFNHWKSRNKKYVCGIICHRLVISYFDKIRFAMTTLWYLYVYRTLFYNSVIKNKLRVKQNVQIKSTDKKNQSGIKLFEACDWHYIILNHIMGNIVKQLINMINMNAVWTSQQNP